MISGAYLSKLNEFNTLLNRPNKRTAGDNGLFERYTYPVLTREHIPLFWKYDLNPETNPLFLERLGVNAVFNAGAIEFNGKFMLIARVEGSDRKSFFAIAESENGIDGFRFRDYPVVLPDIDPNETNVYDIRLTKHEDGYIYGVFCSESRDKNAPEWDTSAAIAQAGIIRTRDMESWERLPNLVTASPQQRNVVLHPEFVDGRYAFYTRPQGGFIDTKDPGICFGLCDDIENPGIKQETLVSPRTYHTITEYKNGQGIVPVKTEKGWLHIAHGVRPTAAGLRYVLYLFVTDLKKPYEVIAAPSGYLLAPLGTERVGDVSNVVFSNGAVVTENGDFYLYYASSDTRMHVATSTVERLLDYAWNTPEDPLRSADCVAQRCDLIEKNLQWMETQNVVFSETYAG